MSSGLFPVKRKTASLVRPSSPAAIASSSPVTTPLATPVHPIWFSIRGLLRRTHLHNEGAGRRYQRGIAQHRQDSALGPCYVVSASGRSIQHGRRDAGAIFAGNKGGLAPAWRVHELPLRRRTCRETCPYKTHCEDGKCEARCRKVLLAQGVVAGVRIFRVGRAAL